MSSPTTTSAQAERSEIKQVYDTVYEFGCRVIEESIEVYETVKCPHCNDEVNPCSGDADLHEHSLPIVGLYMPCLIHEGCGALLTTNKIFFFRRASGQPEARPNLEIAMMTPSAKFEGQAYSLDSRDVNPLYDLQGLRWGAPVAPRMDMPQLSSGHALRALTAKGGAAQQGLGR